MAKIIKAFALFSTLITVFCAVLCVYTPASIFLPLAITFGTTAYHFVMRLLVGIVIDRLLHNHTNYRAKWFQVSTAEQKLYRLLRVHKWKSKMPTYEPAYFDRKLHSWGEIAQAMCQAELVHEVIIVFSFVPLLAAIPFGAFWVFAVTSLLAVCFDAMFVIMQRYNRPRLIQLIERSERKHRP